MKNNNQHVNILFPSIKKGTVYTCERCGKCKLITILPADKEIRKHGWVKKQKIGWVCDECIERFF